MKRSKQQGLKLTPVNVMSICRVDDVYRLGYDGFKVDFKPDEAYNFYCNIEKALQKSSPEYDPIIGIRVVGVDGYLDVKREQLCDIYRFFKKEINAGKSTFDYMFN